MENQELLQAMFEEATLGILVVNADGEIQNANPFSEKLFGYDKGELQDQKVEMLLPEAFRKAHVQHRKKYHQHPSPRPMGANLELAGQRKDGSEFPVEISLSFTNVKNEKLAIAYVSDISYKKKSESINRDISRIVEESLNEIFIFDAENLKFIQANKGARLNIGYSMEELRQLTPIDIKPLFSEKQFVKVIQPLLNREKQKLQFETIHQRKDKTTYPVEIHLQYSTLGNEPVFIATILDISERKKVEEKLKQLNIELEEKVKDRTLRLRDKRKKLEKALEKEKQLSELKSRFVSMASHEFRTPLSSILSSANLIGRYKESEQQDKRMRHVNRIASSVKNLTFILNDFLSLEKLESGKVNFFPAQIDFEEYIESFMDEIRLLAKGKQEIIFNHSGKKEVLIDDNLVKNVLINLLSNAVKYSPNEEDVEIISKNENGWLEISVKDNGIGIPKTDHAEMFSRFFRAKNVENIQGTGLGLTIVKRYVDLMGGEIGFESEQYKGSTFKVKIPQNVK